MAGLTSFEWRPFLEAFSRDLLADPDVRRSLGPDVVASEWLGFQGATASEIQALERRIGRDLPPSYRAFLATSNGWRNVGAFINRVWSTEEVAWFRVRNQDWIDAYVEPLIGETWRPDAEYLVYGERQDSVLDRPHYLQTALEVSDTGDSAILLLNPETVTPDGEWEAWFFANWLPGANRYPSFQALMEAERRRFLEIRDIEDGPPPSRPSPWQTLWRAIRGAWRSSEEIERRP